ncbi:MAG: M48 family metallopeptidase [Bacteroidota bacterium]|nr:M48 family metallopeptidase [Bacteroidota bacterium]
MLFILERQKTLNRIVADKCFITLFLLLSFFKTSFAQKSAYQFPEKFPQFYNFHAEEAFEKLNKKPLHGLNEKESAAFRMSTIYGLQQSFDQNEAYLDWIQAEDYLKKIYDTLIPVQYREKYHMQLFVARDPSINARANDNGFLFINIGLLASMRDEAALACIIGHETGHAVYDHGYNKYVDFTQYKNNNPQTWFDRTSVRNFFSRNYEITADTFSYVKMAIAGYNLNAVKGEFNIYDYDMKRSIHTSLSAFGEGSMRKVKDYLKTYSSHPLNENRVKMAQYYAAKVYKPGRNYIVDSVLFHKIRKFAQEECKRILFENADYKECLRRSFVDYLYNGKNLKNLYYIIECIRRLEYVDPELGKKGFLADEYSDKEFVEYNSSILKKPELLFLDSLQENELSNHPLLADPAKPFNTYDEAMVYFCDKAKTLGFNEANFSLGLYYYAKKDEDNFIFYTDEYIKGNGGMNTEFATAILQSKKPTLTGNKMLFIYDNSGINAEDNFWYGSNYYQIKAKRKLNKEVAPILADDTSKVKLVFVNEFLGIKPRDLYHYQKLEKQMISLYNNEEKQLFRKKRVSSKESIDEIGLTHKYTKNIFIYAPEFYTWFKTNDYGAMCFANVSYDYEEALDLKEMRNDYTAYYFNFNVTRPYFKTGIRSLSVKKQTDIEISQELVDFLYAKD